MKSPCDHNGCGDFFIAGVTIYSQKLYNITIYVLKKGGGTT